MYTSSDVDDYRLEQIASIASSERVGSPLFFSHIGLLLFGGVIAFFLFELWWLSGIILLYVLVFTCEKSEAAKADANASSSSYFRVLSLLFLRALTYNGLVFAVWSTDGDIFKLAALALLLAATINIMVFHATYPAIIACVVAPIWLGFAALVSLFYYRVGISSESIAAALTLTCISPYFYLALRSASQKHRELTWTRQALNRSQKQEVIGNLVSGVAHDFNNILAVTQGYAELIKGEATEKSQNQFADEIIKAAARGASLSGQLLSFAGRAKLLTSSQSIGEVLSNLEEMVSRLLPENVEVKVHHPNEELNVLADRTQLEVALLNLAINARDAMPDGGKLVIDAKSIVISRSDSFRIRGDLKAGSYVVIQVADTGIGMSQELQKEVFDPFFTTKPAGQGTGLGLSMALGFAKQSDGTVTIESKVGDGTSARLFLPSTMEQTPSKTKQSKKPSKEMLAHILVVEDDPPVRHMLESHLTAYGHRVSVASSGQEATSMLHDGLCPNLIVTDNVMPGTVQGIDLARLAAGLTPPIPTVIVSGYSEDIQNQLTNDGLSVRVLQKPVESALLLASIADALQYDAERA